MTDCPHEWRLTCPGCGLVRDLDPAQARADDLEELVLDSIAELAAADCTPHVELLGRLLDLTDEIQDARHRQGRCGCDTPGQGEVCGG